MHNLVQYDCSSDSSSEDEVKTATEGQAAEIQCKQSEVAVKHSPLRGLEKLPTNSIEINGDGDQADKHLGRIRTFEHERGNWASYVSIPVPNLDDFDELADSLIEVLQSECQYPHPFHKIEDPHISVTRTLKLRHHWLPDMTKSLTAIANTHRRFYLSLRDVAVYTNDEETRSFVSIRVVSGQDKVVAIMKDLDGLLSTYNLPPFYEEPSFHVSLCWCLMNAKSSITKTVMSKLQDCVDEWLKDNEQSGFFCVNHLLWKAGNKETPLTLSS